MGQSQDSQSGGDAEAADPSRRQLGSIAESKRELAESKRVTAHLDGELESFSRATFAQVKRGKLDDYYARLEELGTGSFGVVSRGKDVRNDSLVAIKTIPKKKIKDPKKVLEEFNVLRQLDHPHICKAYECYEDRKNIYLVMELLHGGTLLESLCKEQKFTEADAGDIMRQSLSALAYLHEANFIFRDLKTENIMFRAPAVENNEREVKLIDFGLCCSFERGSKMCRAAGTPYSVAPELVTSPVQYDQKCDAWSAGVVMYIMLSGKYPFRGKTKEELLQKIRKEPCSFTDQVWKKISKDAKTLLAELMRKKSEQRTSVSEALMHPWFARAAKDLPSENIMAEIVEGFKHFQNLNMFQKAAVTALAWRASDEETSRLRQMFSCLDRDGNGHITVQELRGAIATSGVSIPEDLVHLALQADTDGGGTIEYTEFLAACLDKRKIIREEVVWEAFRIFDQDGSGTITKKELMKILTGTTGDRIRQMHGNKAVDNFLDEYDVSGDDVIDFEEFMDMLTNVKDTFMTPETNPPSVRRSEAGSPRPKSARRRESERRVSRNFASSERSDLHPCRKDQDYQKQEDPALLGGRLGGYLAWCSCSSLQRGGEREGVTAKGGIDRRPSSVPRRASSRSGSKSPRHTARGTLGSPSGRDSRSERRRETRNRNPMERQTTT